MQSNAPYSIGGEPALSVAKRRMPLPVKLLMPAFLAVGIVVVLPLLFSF
jgi:multiple sugar transport system permease protein